MGWLDLFDVLGLLGNGDGSETELKDEGSGDSSSLDVVGGELGVHGVQVVDHGNVVGQKVGPDKRKGLLWVLEGGGPGLNSLEVRGDVSAVKQVLWHGQEHVTDVGKSRHDVSEVLLGEEGDGVKHLGSIVLNILEAGVELAKVVL